MKLAAMILAVVAAILYVISLFPGAEKANTVAGLLSAIAIYLLAR